MPQTYHISNLIHGDIDPVDPSSPDWTPIVKVAKSKVTWQLEPYKDTSAYYIRLNDVPTKETEGRFNLTEEYLGAARTSVTDERWFITKDNKGNFMIHRAASGPRIHAHWELSSSEVDAKVQLEGGHTHGKSGAKLGKFLDRLVQPNSGLSLDDFDDDIDNDAFWKIPATVR